MRYNKLRKVLSILFLLLSAVNANSSSNSELSNKQANSSHNSETVSYNDIKPSLLNKFDKSNARVDKYVNEKISDMSEYQARANELTIDNIRYEKTLRSSEQLTDRTADIIIDGVSRNVSNYYDIYDKKDVDRNRWYKLNSKTIILIEPITNKYFRYYLVSDYTKFDADQRSTVKEIFNKKYNGVGKLVEILDVLSEKASISRTVRIKNIAAILFNKKHQLIAYKEQAISRFRLGYYTDEDPVLLDPDEINIDSDTTKITKISESKYISMPIDNILWLTCSNVREFKTGSMGDLRDLHFIFKGDENAVFDQEHPKKLYSLKITNDKFYLKRDPSNKYGLPTIEIDRKNGKLTGSFGTNSNVTGKCSPIITANSSLHDD